MATCQRSSWLDATTTPIADPNRQVADFLLGNSNTTEAFSFQKVLLWSLSRATQYCARRMTTLVSDDLVAQYAAMVRAGEATKDLFPVPMSECKFTPAQRGLIKRARADRKAAQRKTQPQATKPTPAQPKPAQPSALNAKAASKLRQILYLQSGRCFFCNEMLPAEHASVEHLNPKSRGGTNHSDNLVVCHKSLNEVFGAMDLKNRFALVFKSAGKFKCLKP